MQLSVLRDLDSQRRYDPEKSIGSRSLEESSTLSNQVWSVFCYICTSTLFSSKSIAAQRVTERFFAEFFSFLFDNTSRYYFVFAFLFPTLKLYFILVIIDEYGLRQCYRLFVLIYSYSTLSLNQSKSNLAVILIQGFKQTLVFSHKFELSKIKPTRFLYATNHIYLIFYENQS